MSILWPASNRTTPKEAPPMAIYPTGEQFQELMKGPQDQPVVMLNLLRFKPRADA